ncbi:MAG: OmpA family protein [Ignavibacteriae bacterium HGW-Ignavibacteriae-4]|jgi:outer membrane protein OmpA-like peptidoglycan-associated protein|nr:MAG: OmpA family protein [Ignavibacteriae bacterium HGW-Ignavibacteriae-4]
MKKYFFILFLVITAPLFSQKLIYNQNFDGKLEPKNLTLDEREDKKGEIDDGYYTFSYVSGDNTKFSIELLDIKDLATSNYTIETKMEYQDGSEDMPFGLVLNSNNDADDFYLFSISDNGFFRIQSYYNDEYHEQVGWTKTDAVNQGGSNVLRVERINYIARYYINGVNVYNDEYFIPNGYWCGFFLTEEGQEIEVDYLKFWESEKTIDLIDNPLTDIEKIVLTELNSETDELSPRIAPDGKTIFFTRDDHPEHFGSNNNQDIWFSELKDGKWGKPKIMPKPINNSGSNSLITITPDYNTVYLSNLYDKNGEPDGSGMSISKRNSMGWEVPTKVEIDNFHNSNQYVSYFMSQDKKILFTAIETESSRGSMDLYLSKLEDDGSYTEPVNLGDNINTFADDFNPFLAADNTTLYYISAGLPGYGREDVWVTKRLDDTWMNWSKPKNLGPAINSSGREFAFTLTAKGDEAYMISYEKLEGSKGAGDIVKVQLSKSAQPDPVVLVYGKVLNKKTNEPIAASIEYFGLKDDKNYGNATSNPETGEYKIILPRGVNYGFKSSAKGFISVSENLDLTELKEYKEIEKNLYLVPVEIGQTIRLNNIFFDTGLAILREESENELENLKKLLSDNSKMTIEVSGHTDNVGNDANNMKLSSDRAQAVVQWLLDKGINTSRLTSKGYGETKPIGSNSTEEGKQLNRRVEFTIITQ